MQYSTNIKSKYIRHLQRKFSCKHVHNISSQELLQEILQNAYVDRVRQLPTSMRLSPETTSTTTALQHTRLHKCKFCGKVYSTNSHMHRHMRVCKSKSTNNINNDTLQEMIQQSIHDSFEHWKGKIGHVTNHFHTQQINNTQIFIHTHGFENIQHITQAYVHKLLGLPFGAVPKLLKEIHFNPKHPENCNVLIPNKKQKWAKVWEGEQWKLRYKKEVIRNMVDKGFHIIDEQFHHVHNRLEDTKKKRYINFQQKFASNDKDLHRTLETDIELIILNNSSQSGEMA